MITQQPHGSISTSTITNLSDHSRVNVVTIGIKKVVKEQTLEEIKKTRVKHFPNIIKVSI